MCSIVVRRVGEQTIDSEFDSHRVPYILFSGSVLSIVKIILI